MKGYGLDKEKSRFLQTWALYKIDRFLHQSLRLRTACEFLVVDIKVPFEGPENQSRDLGGGNDKWPSSSDILKAFTTSRDSCFPRQTEGDAWTQQRVVVVTYAEDIVVKEELTDGLTGQDFDLEGFKDRAEVKRISTGKGAQQKSKEVLVITGGWPVEDQQALLEKNPARKKNDEGDKIDNPAHDVVKKALEKWKDASKKLQKQMAGTEDDEDQE